MSSSDEEPPPPKPLSNDMKSYRNERQARDNRDDQDYQNRRYERHNRSPLPHGRRQSCRSPLPHGRQQSSRSRSPCQRRSKGNGPVFPRKPTTIFKRNPEPTTSGTDDNKAAGWSTRIAAVASNDAQRSKFEKLLGMHKNKSDDGAAVKQVAEEDVKSARSELNKMRSDLDMQYSQGRAFTHGFRGRGL